MDAKEIKGIEQLTDYLKELKDTDAPMEMLTLALGDKEIEVRKVHNQSRITGFEVPEGMEMIDFIPKTCTSLIAKLPIQGVMNGTKSRHDPAFHLDTGFRVVFAIGEANGHLLSFTGSTEKNRAWLEDYFRYREREPIAKREDETDEEYKKRLSDYPRLDEFMHVIDHYYPSLKPKTEDEQPGRVPH